MREKHILLELSENSYMKSSFIVKAYGTFKEESKLYYWMEFIQGTELHHLIRIRNGAVRKNFYFYGSEVLCAL